MTKIYNAQLFGKGEGFELSFYTREAPELKDYVSEVMYSDAINEWKRSKQTVPIHPTQLQGFFGLVFKEAGKDYTKELKTGIDLPTENIYFDNRPDENGYSVLYAFLKSSAGKEEKYYCMDCKKEINEGEFKTFGVCDSCYGKAHPKMVDWNQFSMDEIATFLTNEYQVHSSGKAFAIMSMVNFYNKNKAPVTVKSQQDLWKELYRDIDYNIKNFEILKSKYEIKKK